MNGWRGVRLGLQEDFGERLLPGVLGRFARAHPKLHIEARVASNARLKEDVSLGRLDLALVWKADSEPLSAETLAKVPMKWIGPVSSQPPNALDDPLPLVALEAPCMLRQIAIEALDRVGIAWRISFSSASLAATWAAITAGLRIGIRTPLCFPAQVRALNAQEVGLPQLPGLELSLYHAETAPSLAVTRLGQIIRQHVAELVSALAVEESVDNTQARNGII